MRAPSIQDYAIIGNGRAAALVSLQGSVDWLCWPRFDSPSLFARLLDTRIGGCWRIGAAAPAQTTRWYIEDTNVLQTRFENDAGSFVLTDLMPVASEEQKQSMLMAPNEILRGVECVRGTAEVEVLFEPRPGYATDRTPLVDGGTLGLRLEMGGRLVTLRGPAPFSLDGKGTARAHLRLTAGESAFFSLTYSDDAPAVLAPLGDLSRQAIARSVDWWRSWSRRTCYDGPYRNEVVRSALVLKLLTFAPSGAVIAAPTTSLPERIGGDLNWDYRFCWLRDASFTSRALLGLGYAADAEAFISWLLHSTRLTRPELRVFYDVYGRTGGNEKSMAQLDGYRGSRPVHVGNAAGSQRQLDSYGEVVEAVAQLARRDGHLDRETQNMLRDFGGYVCDHWDEPGNGIWEARGPGKKRTFSRVLCWTALDRLLEMRDRGRLEKIPADRFAAVRAQLRQEIEEHGWNESGGTYTEILDEDQVDASLLLLPWYGYDKADAPRIQRTYETILKRLRVGDGLLYRHEQSYQVGEGAFGICSFWWAEFLALGGGSLDKAQRTFEKMLRRANDVGLYSEEIDPQSGEALGNFPQGLTHLGLINAALSIEQRRKRQQVGTGESVPAARTGEEDA